MQKTIVTIKNIRGLHARAAAKFVKIVERHKVDVKVRKHIDKEQIADSNAAEEELATVNGSSILGLMMLAAEKGTKLEIIADAKGENDVSCKNVLKELEYLVDNLFHEEE